MVIKMNIILISLILIPLHSLLGNCLLINQGRSIGKRNGALYQTEGNKENLILDIKIENYVNKLKKKSGKIKLYIFYKYYYNYLTYTSTFSIILFDLYLHRN